MSVATTGAQAMSTHNATGNLFRCYPPQGADIELLLYENIHIISSPINKYNRHNTK